MSNWRLARSLLTLREQVNAAAPNRSKASDGSVGDAAHFATGSASDHNPWCDGNVVTAIDITHDPANGCDVWAIAKAIAASRDRRLKYLIWTGQDGGRPGILSSKVSPWTWRTRMVDDHPHHLHVSVMPDRALYDSVAKWALTMPVAAAMPATTPQTPVKQQPQEDTMPWFFRAKTGAIVIVTPTGVRGVTKEQWAVWTHLGFKVEPNMQALDPGPFAAILSSLGGLVK